MLREFFIYLSAFIGLFAVIFYFLGLLEGRKKDSETKDIDESDLPSVSIIIPAYNEEKGIADTIKSALNLDYPKNKLSIIVVDDGSRDKTYSIAKRFESSIVKIYTKKNGGKGTALNFGIKKAGSEIMVTMDADTIAERNALKKMVRYFARKEVMCVTPAMVIHNPKGILVRVQQIEYFLGIFLRKAFSSMNAIHITPGAFSAYRKAFFDRYGGFDEKNITEDLEIALRIQAHHFHIENSLESVIYTIPPKKFSDLIKQRKRWYNGLMINLWNYRRLFSRDYGDLGVIVLPTAVITIILSVSMTIYIAIKAIFDIWKEILLFRSINFDISNFFDFNKYVFERFFFTIFSNPIFVMSILFIGILLGYMFFAKSKVKRDSAIKFSLIVFLALYGFLFAFWWILSLFDTLLKRKVVWGK